MDESTGKRRLAAGRILIVGCGDVGLRVVHLLKDRWRLFALARSRDHYDALRRAGVIPIAADLDDPASLLRIAGLAPWVVHLAPPQASGTLDLRTRHLIAALGSVERLVYVSTSGVYGDCHGARIDETRRINPQTERALRRVDAENCLRAWARRQQVRLSILRTPGIYAAERLPLARLRAATPVLCPNDDVYTNHIHADDLARTIVAALHRAASLRVYHASDSSELLMGEYFEMVARAFGLALPPRLARRELQPLLPETALSFMRESRRLSNARVLGELALVLRYPRVADLLATLAPPS